MGLCIALAAVARADDVAPGPLSRAQAIQHGLTRNVAVLTSRLAALRADQLWRAAWQDYVPTLAFDTAVRRDTPPIDAFGRSTTMAYSAGLVWNAPIGTSVELLGVTTHGLGAGFGLATDGSLRLAVVQPLLKGGWYAGALQPLREADSVRRIQQEVFKDAVNQLIVEIDGAYWDLAVAQTELTVKGRSLDRARQQYDDTAENIRRGILATGEIYVVEENVVSFEQDLIGTEQAVTVARRRLAALLQFAEAAALGASDVLEGAQPSVVDPKAARAEASRAHPALAARRLRAQLAQSRLTYASTQFLPELNLNGSVAVGGTSLVLQGLWGTVLTDPGPDARVGVSFELPLDRSGASAEVAAAKLDLMQEELGVQGEATRVSYGVDNSLTEVETSAKQLAMTRKRVELAELKLQTETEKYKNGVSALVDVVRFQRDLDSANISLQRVLRDVRVGNTRLLASQGTLYQTVGATLK